jgi:uncharacterized protein YecE (DUF72 family)
VSASQIFIGTAGWAVPTQVAAAFPTEGSSLERYAARFTGAEINTTFYRPPQIKTFERWAASVPPNFRFAVKAPREITHYRKLVEAREPLAVFLDQTAALDGKLGPILFQLPPSSAFDTEVAGRFLDDLRQTYPGPVALEARHPSWFDEAAERLLIDAQVARVAADPPRAPADGRPGGWTGLAYWRLHGSPRLYYSAYDDDRLTAVRQALDRSTAETRWCIFDNTASGAAASNALAVLG